MELSIFTGIVILAIGLILYFVRNAFANAAVQTVFYVLGIIGIVVGALVIAYGAFLLLV